MQKTRFLAAAVTAALSALTACSGGPEVIQANQFDAQAEALKNAAPVAPPPMIQASRAYRCSDNSLFYVDFYSNNTATIRTTQDGMPNMLAATDGNPPYAGEGFSVSANANNVRISAPGHNNVSCHI